MKIIAQGSHRIDKFLQQTLNEPRNQIERLIKLYGVNIDGKLVKKTGFKLKGGEEIEFDLPTIEEREESLREVDFDIDILYEDDDILIINKPPFVTVHPAPSVKEATVVDWLKKRGVSLSTISGEERHGIVHRIDKETSGALVVAKNNTSHQNLAKQLEDKSMGRYYLAIIDLPLKENTIIDKAISRDRNYRTRMVAHGYGKEAKSAFVKLSSSQISKKELIAIKLFTGRTHQIRAHLRSINRAIIGDELYGFKSKKDNIPRVMLHATIIYLRHPKSGEMIIKEAPLFDDFRDILDKEFKEENLDEKLKHSYIVNCFTTND